MHVVNRREYFSLPKDEINHDDPINDDDACAWKEDFTCYQIKYRKELQNVKHDKTVQFFEKLSDFLNLLLKDDIPNKDKIGDILLKTTAEHVLEHLSYIAFKNVELSTQNDQQLINSRL